MSAGLQAAIRYFPNNGKEIETRSIQDQDFKQLCEDLADAESALTKWKKSSDAVLLIRSREYQALVDELVAEIAAILTGHKTSSSQRRKPE